MKKILSLLALTALTIGLLGSCCKKEDPKVSETKTMAEILKTATGIPESQNLTPPEDAWVNSTNPDCKAFVGVDKGKKVFIMYKKELVDPETQTYKITKLEMLMDDTFEKTDDNTYERVESVGTFTVKMTGDKFTSYKFEAASGSDYAALNGTYSSLTGSAIEGFDVIEDDSSWK